MAKAKKRGKPKDSGRRVKKKVSILSAEQIEYVDWKDANLLRRFLSERSKIRARRVTGNNTQQQKMVADAIKIAREMALVPYANRVTTQRSGRGDRERISRADGPLPRPSGPPPASWDEDGDMIYEEAELDVGVDHSAGADHPAEHVVDADLATSESSRS
ncbi:MAG: 30S ribosomal protein S18 [Acidimicrobiaceae bacterium]|nr:30S ribosomal protein S18 [Acidimicrobiaceae bacterium]MYA73130.1 30S ribosomal protein S18 [Acidimicrobiaceae bacterium]MYC42145.1 30S ribosomal protein S18 [Acidimicrobiaceae bacterium]MYG54265.1 30S ribosomal protein S18 [Acidimicrobiaceae bacterium]MYJ99794.1 30S ribosomal protein S18 [Acidimicrobiaceae bacterium]